jgi:Cu+-exporting ATPase
MLLPILVLIYIIPYAKPEFITSHNSWNGIPLYVYLNCIFATIIQLFMGFKFYISAYKALRHKSANMDVLIMMGTTAAWLYGVVNIGIGFSQQDMMDHDMFQMMV